MKYSIALTPYLNTRPFFYHEAPGDFSLLAMSPRESVQALAEGNTLAGIVPVAGLERLRDCVDLLGEFGIASNGPVRSVLFFSQRPFAAFTRDCRIRLSRDSLTSVRLLALLFGYRIGFDNLPGVLDEGATCDGELLIGDHALRRMHEGNDDCVTDLAQEWAQHHHCPFVFARWVIRKDAPATARAQLLHWLDAFVQAEDPLQRLTAEREAARYGLAPESIVRYLQGIRTRIGREELHGQALYLSELEKHRPSFSDVIATREKSVARR